MLKLKTDEDKIIFKNAILNEKHLIDEGLIDKDGYILLENYCSERDFNSLYEVINTILDYNIQFYYDGTSYEYGYIPSLSIDILKNMKLCNLV